MCRNKQKYKQKWLIRYIYLVALIISMAASVTIAAVERAPAGDAGTVETQSGSGVAESTIIPIFNCEEDFGIRKALAMLGSMCNKNIVPSPGIDGSLAFRRLTNVTFEEALDAILGDSFEYEQQGNLIKVYTKEEYKKLKEDLDRRIYKIFTLYYISAAEARKLITPVLSGNGNIETTTPAQTEFPTGQSISSGTGGGDTTAMNDTVIVFDYPENIEKVIDVLSEVDIRPKQVLVEATILSATLTEEMQFGIDWQTLKGSAVTTLSGVSRGTEYLSSVGSSAKVESALSGGLTYGVAHDDVAAIIRAVETVSDVTVLANPKVLAINKQLGQVYIGNKYGYREGNTFDAAGNMVEGAVQFLDTGTKLSFRPYIADDGYIRMDIHPKDSSGAVTSGVPEETSAELVTNIMVKDGQTIVIGGLFRDSTTTVRTQVPLLGDLPFIGALFRGKADKVERQEVIVLLTPHIIDQPMETDGQARADDIQRKRAGTKDELQEYSRARLAEEYYASAVKLYNEGQLVAAMEEVESSLKLRPSYLEAIRLKERIIADKDGSDAMDRLQRKMLEDADSREAPKWLRR